MKIAIDVNDVLRDFTRQFAKCYKNGYDHTFDLDELEAWTNDVESLFPFKSHAAFERFTYEDYAFEIFGSAPNVSKRLPELFNEWYQDKLPNLDLDEDIDVAIISPMEGRISIPSTLFFLSKFGIKVREYYFPSDSLEVWNMYDVVITANPTILNNKPSDKISVKIEKEYNEECNADYSYFNMEAFLNSENNIKEIYKKYEGE